jgi:hypothetical protein
MWRLPVPSDDNWAEDLSAALTFVNGTPVFDLTDEHRQSIRALYERYVTLMGRPDSTLAGVGLDEILLKSLHDAYGEVYDGRRLGKLRERLKIAAFRCPYCGFGEIKDLDHHLPRSKYRGLAIYSLNLVPCCHPCNNKKRAIAGENPDTQFHHTYLDVLPPDRFLIAKARISSLGMIVDFSIIKTTNISEDVFRRLTFQFERLDLNLRYQAEISSFVTSHRTAIEMIGSCGSAALKKFLEKARDDAQVDFGLNHWQTALWQALSENDVFCDGGYIFAFGKKQPGG